LGGAAAPAHPLKLPRAEELLAEFTAPRIPFGELICHAEVDEAERARGSICHNRVGFPDSARFVGEPFRNELFPNRIHESHLRACGYDNGIDPRCFSMPILAPEPELLPPNMFDSTYESDSRQWWVAHTLPRQEKALARQLHDAALPYYMPCDRRRTKVRNRVVTAHVPLFSGYLFVRAAEEERVKILKTKRLAGLLNVRDQDRLWQDLRRVRKVLDLGVPVTIEQRLAPGTPVTIRNGPLSGMSGTVIKSNNGFQFTVAVDFLQRGISVTLDGKSLGVNAD